MNNLHLQPFCAEVTICHELRKWLNVEPGRQTFLEELLIGQADVHVPEKAYFIIVANIIGDAINDGTKI